MKTISDTKLNPALRNRPSQEHTNEVLGIIRKSAEVPCNNSADVHFDKVLLRRVSIPRPIEPLPSIRIDNEFQADDKSKRRSCPDELDIKEPVDEARWRSLSDGPFIERRHHSPLDRNRGSPSSGFGRVRRMSNLPPLETYKDHGLERPSCLPSFRNSDDVAPLRSKDNTADINRNYESQDMFGANEIREVRTRTIRTPDFVRDFSFED
ncbi:PREDICTED: uncharacterized protein LOC107355299 [Acropora digitifera]|uniref:uncharacterized protein LOC107355299 n=1 Tax=Acropora digitifera TaxID=70779 RepID=UPI00077B1F03|nr:PREDICTED: uncharacterized protein LOC107355299 [Acropora digitifera]